MILMMPVIESCPPLKEGFQPYGLPTVLMLCGGQTLNCMGW